VSYELPGKNMTAEANDEGLAGRTLGSAEFRANYQVDYAYVAGSMYRGISSEKMVASLSQSRILSFLGIGGMPVHECRMALERLSAGMHSQAMFGANMLAMHDQELEWQYAIALAEFAVPVVEASGYAFPTEPLVYVRAKMATRTQRLIAKLSRIEVADWFLRPPPERLLQALIRKGRISPDEARAATHRPIADDICVEADSGGHTDRRNPLVILPRIRQLAVSRRDLLGKPPCVGLAGGIGTPAAIIAALCLGADFVLTGSINQCTVEAGMSSAAKALLATADVHDTTYVPLPYRHSEDVQLQVLRKGTGFPNRARQIGRKGTSASEAEGDRHAAFSLMKTYYGKTSNDAFDGQLEEAQIHSSGAIGAFNAWYRDSDLEPWDKRYVARVAKRLMADAAALLTKTRG
jgi:trans-AT polyketide synthase/acyltransferase/oxidoreductase domain-containing protein